VDMTRMARVVAYDPGDLTLSAEPGIRLQEIAAALAEHRQFLPLDVPYMDRATVGGTIASGIDSPLRHSYGTARDFVLGMEFVTGDGTRAKSGGRVVKNVSGYDIHKMMIGSLGTLGIITRINVRTFPMPRRICTFVATFRGLEGACELRNAIARSVLRPRSLEICAASDTLCAQLGQEAGTSLPKGRWALIAAFAGDDEVLKRDRRELELLTAGCRGGSLESVSELRGEAAEQVTRFVAEFPAAVRGHSPAAAIFKISAQPAELAHLARDIQSIAMPWGAMMRGLGVAYLSLVPPDSSGESLDLLKQECRRILARAGRPPWRHVTLPWCPTGLKREMDVWGAPAANLALMQKLKGVFDSGGILSPGRFVGGI
jgi:glycolate oxidase FAD binding subunit